MATTLLDKSFHVQDSDKQNLVEEMIQTTQAHFGGPGSGTHMGSADGYALIVQLDGTQNWVGSVVLVTGINEQNYRYKLRLAM